VWVFALQNIGVMVNLVHCMAPSEDIAAKEGRLALIGCSAAAIKFDKMTMT